MLYVYTKWKERIQKSVPEICPFLDYLHYQNSELCWHQLFMWVHHQKDPLTGGQESISMYPMYVWMFICVYMYPYLPINICISLSLHPYLFKSGKKKKRNQNQNCSHGKYEVKINGQNIFILQSMSNQGRNASANNWLTVSV